MSSTLDGGECGKHKSSADREKERLHALEPLPPSLTAYLTASLTIPSRTWNSDVNTLILITHWLSSSLPPTLPTNHHPAFRAI
jgi:hypothetical protein